MKFLLLIFCFCLAESFTNATRHPANCGNGSPFFLSSVNENDREEQWATNYHGLMLKAYFDYSKTKKVTWTINYDKKTVHHSFLRKDYMFYDNEWISDEYKSEQFIFTLIGNLAKSEVFIRKTEEKVLNMDVKFYADSDQCTIKNIVFKDCRTHVPHQLVSSSASTFLSRGHITCEEGYSPFPSDASRSTTCTVNGEWDDAVNNLKCYAAAKDTRVIGNLTVKENDEMQVDCNFTQANPFAHQWKLSFGEEVSVHLLNKTYLRNITLEDDGKEIRCQPLSNYTETEKFSHKGKSPSRQLRVLFSPRILGRRSTHSCTWKVGSSNICNFTFLSSPLAEQISLSAVKNGTDTSNESGEVNFKYMTSFHGYRQTIAIVQIEDSKLLPPKLQLEVKSSLFPENSLQIPFDLNVKYDQEYESHSSNTIYIVIGSVTFLVVIILLIAAVIHQVRKHQSSKEMPPGNINSTLDTETSVFYQSSCTAELPVEVVANDVNPSQRNVEENQRSEDDEIPVYENFNVQIIINNENNFRGLEDSNGFQSFDDSQQVYANVGNTQQQVRFVPQYSATTSVYVEMRGFPSP